MSQVNPSERVRKSKLHLLAVSTGPRDTYWAHNLVIRLSKNPWVECRAIVDESIPRLSQTVIALQNRTLKPYDTSLSTSGYEDTDGEVGRVEYSRQQAFELVQWADVMVCLPLDADGIAKMLSGIADTLLGEIFRGWNTHKPIALAPGMSTAMWKNPLTQRQLTTICDSWSWITLMPPILWTYKSGPKYSRVVEWDSFHDVLEFVQNMSKVLGVGVDSRVAIGSNALYQTPVRVETQLPLEIWSIILEFVGDWELAQGLGIHAALTLPEDWRRLKPTDLNDESQIYHYELMWLLLTGGETAICRKLSMAPASVLHLTPQFTQLALRFSRVDVLKWLDENRRDLLQLCHPRLAHLDCLQGTSLIAALDYLRHSPWFAFDHEWETSYLLVEASSRGLTNVLEWWRRCSGLPLVCDKSALEEASSNGHVNVLEWWREAAALDDKVVLCPGDSLLCAARAGNVDSMRWWKSSGISTAHGSCGRILYMGSKEGSTKILESWRHFPEIDEGYVSDEVLIVATTHNSIQALRWWRLYAQGKLEGQHGRRHPIHYRPRSIQEAYLQSSWRLDGAEPLVLWWAQHGVKLGEGCLDDWDIHNCLS